MSSESKQILTTDGIPLEVSLKKAEKKKETNVMTNKEIVNLMTSEIGPSGKVLFVALAFSGGVDVHPYRAGDAYGLHPYEVHQGLSELKHRSFVSKGESNDCVNVVREKING